MTTRRRRAVESELDALVEAGVLAPEAAARVRAHYRGTAAARAALPLFAVLGATLVALGVILLLAHNWELLGRATRAGIALGWLLAGQGVALFARLRRPGSTAWSEAGALFASLSLAGCLALIAQTYQLPQDLGSFVARWAWLSLPVAYALDSRAGVALVIALSGVRLIPLVGEDTSPLAFWALFAACVPYLVWLAARSRGSLRDGLVAWVAAPVLIFACALHLPLLSSAAVLALVLGIAAALHALGAPAAGEPLPAPFAAQPFRIVGAGTVAVLVLVLSHAEPWGGVSAEVDRSLGWIHVLPVLAVTTLALLAIGWRARAWWRERDVPRALWLAAPLAFGLAWTAGLLAASESAAAWTMAVYGLALGSGTVLGGLEERSLARANGGMLLLGGVIALRFLDSDWSFTARGLVFIALGASFLAFNLVMRRRLAPAALADPS